MNGDTWEDDQIYILGLSGLAMLIYVTGLCKYGETISCCFPFSNEMLEIKEFVKGPDGLDIDSWNDGIQL